VELALWLGLNKRLESFGPCHSQSLLLADFKEEKKHWYSSLILKNPYKKIHKKTQVNHE
jgi:hypothetical protein